MKINQYYKSAVIMGVLFFLCTLCTSPLLAVLLEPHPKVCAEFFDSNTIVIGKVISEQEDIDKEDGESINGWWYKIKVSRVFRGTAKKVIKVYTENTSIRFPLKVGCEYLLFAYKGSRGLEICDGGNSGLLSERKKEIQEIKQIPKFKDGEIEGRVVVANGDKIVKGIKIKIQGNGKIFYCVTDSKGWFHIRVKPGKYSATSLDEKHIYPSSVSYDDPDNFVVEKGGCAELQFVINGP